MKIRTSLRTSDVRAIGATKFTRSAVGMLAMAAGMGFVPVGVRAEVVTVRSGTVNGRPGSIPTQHDVGDVDGNITYLAGASSRSQLRSNPFTTLDFGDARNGSAAELIVPHPYVGGLGWIQSLPSDPDARWINWNHGQIALNVGSGKPARSVLYACDFELKTTDIVAASIEFHWAVDDLLGDRDGGANEVGVYVNEIALGAGFRGPGAASAGSASLGGIEALLNPGLNTLYVYQRDLGASVSGIIFSATITTSKAAIPAISEWGLVVMMLLLLVGAKIYFGRRRVAH